MAAATAACARHHAPRDTDTAARRWPVTSATQNACSAEHEGDIDVSGAHSATQLHRRSRLEPRKVSFGLDPHSQCIAIVIADPPRGLPCRERSERQQLSNSCGNRAIRGHSAARMHAETAERSGRPRNQLVRLSARYRGNAGARGHPSHPLLRAVRQRRLKYHADLQASGYADRRVGALRSYPANPISSNYANRTA